jgi:integrating conjugative element protein (TIGR03765 family)
MRAGPLHTTTRLRTSGWLNAPLFIVGDDPTSRAWLQTNRAGLQRLGARGLVVNVSTLAAYRSLSALVPDVPMAPGSAEALARQTGLRVYPLFVAVDGHVTQRLP